MLKDMKEKTKVIAYIFRKGRSEVLVFNHADFPEAGTQVVGGTLEEGEDFKIALAREVLEESGLTIDPSSFIKIGETTYHRKDKPEVNFRHYFSFVSDALPERWSNIVKSDGEDNGMIFDFFWLPIEEAKRVLTGNFGELL
ncbi:NUDIX hydrolase [Bacteriovorax stolpii]|nr:NUDIX hydrolase [Bacteriovorax stolpii]